MTTRDKLILLVLALFAIILLKVDRGQGTDLTASYLSCRVMDQPGGAAHLYSQDAEAFAMVSDPLWLEMAAKTETPSFIPPFVQTPLWPFLLRPLCLRTNFPVFRTIFRVLLAFCFASMIWITGRHWAPRAFSPGWVLLLGLLWIKSDPMRDAFQLVQTHPIFLVLTLLAMVWAASGRQVEAGFLLALAAIVKITPAGLVVYWLFTRRWIAALSLVLSLGLLTGLTIWITGMPLMLAYLHNTARVSGLLVLADNNDSFAATWVSLRASVTNLNPYRGYPFPLAVKLFCSACLALSISAGGLADYALQRKQRGAPLYGAVFAMLGATLFAPIAWSHYFLLLVVPMMLAVDEFLRRRAYWMLGLAGLILGFSSHLVFFAPQQHWGLDWQHPLRGPFCAGIIGMVTLAALWWGRYRQGGHAQDAGELEPALTPVSAYGITQPSG